LISQKTKDLIKKERFREDLYYRLFGLPVHLPPLRERDNDALLLAKFFVDAFCKENNLEPKSISENARKKLLSYNWPGNIRELKSVVELAIVMSSGKEISADDISLSTNDALPNVLTDEMTMREYEIRIVNHYMQKCNNSIMVIRASIHYITTCPT